MTSERQKIAREQRRSRGLTDCGSAAVWLGQRFYAEACEEEKKTQASGQPSERTAERRKLYRTAARMAWAASPARPTR